MNLIECRSTILQILGSTAGSRHTLNCRKTIMKVYAKRPALVKGPVHWLRFGFPLGEESDLLEALLALCEAGVTRLPAEAVRLVEGKRDGEGRWVLERALPNTWADFGAVGMPNKWVTLRAYHTLRTRSFQRPQVARNGSLKRTSP